MAVKDRIESLFIRSVDRLFKVIPQPVPDPLKLSSCKIISHRGEHDNHWIMENTIPAFERAEAAGVWGVEFDIRWSRDNVPVVFHDSDLTRLYGQSLRIRELTLKQIRSGFPLIPTLEEVLWRFRGSLHYMIELKETSLDSFDKQKKIFKEALASFEPVKDYHIMSLVPGLFHSVDFVPPQALLPISWNNVSTISRIAIERGYGGFSGHYILLRKYHFRKHRAAGQKIGTGYVKSRNSLFREINRGVEWIFSNDAVSIQKVCRDVHS